MLSFQKILIIFFTVIFGFIIILGIVSYRNNKASNDTAFEIKHTQVVLDEADQILSAAKDLQLESSGYVITGDTNFLATYATSKKNIFIHITALEQLTLYNPVKQPKIDSVRKFVNTLIDFSNQTIQLKIKHQFEEPNLLNKIQQSKFYGNKINEAITEIKKEENRLLTKRETANTKSITAFKATFFAMLALIFLLMNIIFFMINYNFNKQKMAEQKLRESEEQFRLLVNNIEDYAIFMIDPSGHVSSWNNGAEKLKGYSSEEIIGKPTSVFYTKDDIERGEPKYILKMAKEKGKHESEGWRIRKNGSMFWANFIVTAIYNEKGALQGFTKVTRDNTERKKAEESIISALKKEKELNEMKSDFVSTASHEFRTPLSTILSSTFLLEKYTTSEQQEKRSKHIGRIKSSVQNLLAILEDFLSLEKIEEGRVKEKIKIFNLKDLVSDLCKEMNPLAKPGQSIIYNHEGREDIWLDPVFIKQILINLTSNAIKYSDKSTSINICTKVNGEGITMNVKDYGIGISNEDQIHLFKRFFRASNAAGIQGTGLGLHIVKHYVDMLHGTIKIKSELGKGSEFIVELSELSE